MSSVKRPPSNLGCDGSFAPPRSTTRLLLRAAAAEEETRVVRIPRRLQAPNLNTGQELTIVLSRFALFPRCSLLHDEGFRSTAPAKQEHTVKGERRIAATAGEHHFTAAAARLHYSLLWGKCRLCSVRDPLHPGCPPPPAVRYRSHSSRVAANNRQRSNEQRAHDSQGGPPCVASATNKQLLACAFFP